MLALHVVYDAFDDGVGEGAVNVEEEARDSESFAPFFEYPVYH